MEFVDIHTHKLPEEPQNSLHGKIITVVNCSPNADTDRFEYCSVGIHPWDVTKNWQDDFEILKKRVLQPQVVAIGECGLDRLRGGEWSLQKACFQAQIDLAKQTGKPLVLHCVKAVDEVIRMCVGVKCIFHGFRGKTVVTERIRFVLWREIQCG